MSADDAVYCKPDTVADARAAVAKYAPSVKIVSGGQSLTLLLRQGLLSPDALVDVGDIADLGGIEARDDGVRIGATTTYNALARSPVIAPYAGIIDAVRSIAGPQVRNMGTIGGAISHADPSLDIVPPLRCLDATVLIGSVDGTRRTSLAEFHGGYMEADVGDDEIVESVTIGDRAPSQGSAYHKHANAEGGWPTVGVAATVVLSADGDAFEAVRVALAAVADTAVRATSVEHHLDGEPVSTDAIAEAAAQVPADIDPLADHAGSVRYKENLARELTRRSLLTAVDRAGGGR